MQKLNKLKKINEEELKKKEQDISNYQKIKSTRDNNGNSGQNFRIVADQGNMTRDQNKPYKADKADPWKWPICCLNNAVGLTRENTKLNATFLRPTRGKDKPEQWGYNFGEQED
jgi:hypothetical protein